MPERSLPEMLLEAMFVWGLVPNLPDRLRDLGRHFELPTNEVERLAIDLQRNFGDLAGMVSRGRISVHDLADRMRQRWSELERREARGS